MCRAVAESVTGQSTDHHLQGTVEAADKLKVTPPEASRHVHGVTRPCDAMLSLSKLEVGLLVPQAEWPSTFIRSQESSQSSQIPKHCLWC